MDEAVAYFGSTVEYELNKVEAKTEGETMKRRTALLQQYLFPDEKPKAQFADPALLFS